MLALLVQLFVPYLHQPVYAASPEFPWDLSDFCLASGHLPPGYAPTSDSEGPSDPAGQKTPPCSICKTLQHTGSFLPLTAVPVLYRFETAARVHYARTVVALSGRTEFRSQPRAPPVPV